MSIKRKLLQLVRKQVYVFGDSHTEIFDHLNSRRYNRKYYFEVCFVGGATAQGLRNPNSKTKALEFFNEMIDAIKNRNRWLIFSLGEVDTGFVIWYRAEKYNDKILSQLNVSLETYYDFLMKIKSKGFKKIAVLSAPPPTIEDGQDWGEVANLRKDIKATKRERTDLNILYNQNLQSFCTLNEIVFLNCDKILLDTNTNLINAYYLNKDRTNHHLDIDKFSNVAYQLLNESIA